MTTTNDTTDARRQGALTALTWMAEGLDPQTDSYTHLPSGEDEQYFAWLNPSAPEGAWADLPREVRDAFRSGARAAFETVATLRETEPLDACVTALRDLFNAN